MHGHHVLDYGAYYDRTGQPGTDLVQPLSQQDVPNQTRTVFDGAGRPISSIFQPKGVERWRTTTVYGGDHTDVEPPVGATASSTWTDARDHTVQSRRYPTRSATGTDYDHTDYTYNRKGLVGSVATPDGSRWTYGYDLRGRKTSATDPDSGVSTSKYDDAGRLIGSKDGNGNSLTYTYDNLDRKTGLYQGTSVTSSGQLAQWDYDQATFADGKTKVLGRPYQSSRIDSNRRYVTGVSQYDQHYQPLQSFVTIPSGETGLGGTYLFGTGYNPDGSISGASYPASGNLLAETTLYGYNGVDQPLNLVDLYGTEAESSIVSDSQYDALAHATQYTLYTGLFSDKGSRAYLNYETDLATGRLNEISVHRDGVSPNTVTDAHYRYDDSGNVVEIADTPTGGGYSDIQCFTYDRYQRLQNAWTPTADDCASAPTGAALGGPAPYWQSYTYTSGGARDTLVDHATTSGDVTTKYTYTDNAPTDPTAGQPHALRGTTVTDNTGTHTASYTYDKAGNTKTRPGTHGAQTLNWNAEGNLASVTDTAGTVSYLYDADGNRLISRDTTGKTLYLPNEELRYTNSTQALTCTRYYSFGGGTVAQRTSAGLTWLASDHQGTQDLSLDEKTQTATSRRQTPFGTPRGGSVTWANDKGFIGGTADPTGLTHLGAREYDPALGRFISVDPMLDSGDAQSMEGYAYGDNDPVVRADPSGQMLATMSDSGGQADNSTQNYPENNPPSKPKSTCHHFCGLRHAFTEGANWVDQHKAAIAGVATGLVVGIGCGAIIGVTGVGAVACGALAGAAANMVQYTVETEVEHKGNFSLGGMLTSGAEGAIVGGVMGGLGSIGGQAVKAGFSSLLEGVGAKAAVAAGRSAAKKEAGNIVSGLTRNAFGRSAAKASEGAVADSAEDAAASGGGCKGQSFAASTAVLMADGSTKPIAEVKVGDKVRATDPTTGKTTDRVVDAVYVDHDKAMTDLTVRANGHDTVVHTTQQHPFWDKTKKMWVGAGDLAVSDRISTKVGGSTLVVAVVNFVAARDMYDLTVRAIHTFYVLAGNAPVLVHNCDLVAEARAATSEAPSDATMTAAARIKGDPESVEIGHSGASSRIPVHRDIDLSQGGQTFAGDAGNCAEVRACSLVLRNNPGTRLEDIEFITVRTRSGAVEPSCLSCLSTLVLRGATDLGAR